MNCPICQRHLYDYIKTNEFKIKKCSFCGLGITQNLAAYTGDYHRDDEYADEEELFRNIFKKRANLIFKIVKKGTVLEVGCSNGLLLSLLKTKGFNVTGIEVSKPAARLAEKRGIKVIVSPFEKVQLKEKYDAIIFSHTLEHLKDPIGALGKASKYLKKEGILFIDLPNFAGISSYILKDNWPHLLPKEHLWHFTLKAMDTLLKKNGLEIVYSDMSSGIWDLDKPFEELLISFISFKKRFFVNFLSALPTFILSKAKLGSGLMIIGKKI